MASSPISLTRLVESRLARVARAVEEELAAGVAESAEELRNEIRDGLQTGPSPSQPGEPPTDRSGSLTDSIQVHTEESGLRATVRSNLDYAAYLEFGTINMAARPFMRPALERARPRITEIMARAVRLALNPQRLGANRER